MPCPYCQSEIDADASVCAVCRRDLGLVKVLLTRIASLESELASRPAVAPATDEAAALETVEPPLTPPVAVVPERSWSGAIVAWTMPILLLLLAHWLIIFVYDAKVLYLRVIALIIPLPFGVMFARRLHLPFAWSVLPAGLMALAAVLGMSAVTGVLDGVPILPQGAVDIREFVEFAASIGFSFVTGLWLQEWLRRRLALQQARAAEVRRLKGLLGGGKVTDSLSRLNDLGSAVVGVATTAFSIYTGLKGVLGG